MRLGEASTGRGGGGRVGWLTLLWSTHLCVVRFLCPYASWTARKLTQRNNATAALLQQLVTPNRTGKKTQRLSPTPTRTAPSEPAHSIAPRKTCLTLVPLERTAFPFTAGPRRERGGGNGLTAELHQSQAAPPPTGSAPPLRNASWAFRLALALLADATSRKLSPAESSRAGSPGGGNQVYGRQSQPWFSF